jgi:hypothetical protein
LYRTVEPVPAVISPNGCDSQPHKQAAIALEQQIDAAINQRTKLLNAFMAQVYFPTLQVQRDRYQKAIG